MTKIIFYPLDRPVLIKGDITNKFPIMYCEFVVTGSFSQRHIICGELWTIRWQYFDVTLDSDTRS